MWNNDKDRLSKGILVVEDTPESLMLLSGLLTGAGYSVRQAENGEMALTSIRSKTPELILLDISLPGISGYEVCQILKSDPATLSIPVIFLSAHHEIENKSKGFSVGGIDFITKPYNLEEVLLRVNTHLEFYRLRMKLESIVNQRTIDLLESNNSLQRELNTRRKAEKSLRLADQVIEGIFEAVMLVDKCGVIVRANSSFTRVTGYEANESVGKTADFLKSEEYSAIFSAEILDTLSQFGVWHGEIKIRHKTGHLVTNHLAISSISSEDGSVENYAISFTDISKSKDADALINFMAFHDALTGLPNRSSARAHFKYLNERLDDHDELIYVMCLDLDRFKVINDSLGHGVGDNIIKSLAERLQAYDSEKCMISRNGGDEFLFVTALLGGVPEIIKLAECIMSDLAIELRINQHRLTLSTSIGISICEKNTMELEDLIRNAELALYQVKREGGNNFRLYSKEMDEESQNKMIMETQLRLALGAEEFSLVFQPKFSIKNESIIGAEALIRWNSLILGAVPPSSFIPLAEETGLIHPIGEWVLDNACHEIRRLCDMGWKDFKLSVNLSAHQFRQSNLVKIVKHYLDKWNVAPSLLELELTESLLIQNTNASINLMNTFKGLGVSLSLDDFGTGFSSLSYLKKFPIDTLKIDKSFIDALHMNLSDAAIVLTIITLSENLGIKVIAEGVEVKEQVDFLSEHGCDQVQGFYFSKPLSSEDFESMLAKSMNFSISDDIKHENSYKNHARIA